MSLKKHVVECACGHARYVTEDTANPKDFAERKVYYETAGLCRDCEQVRTFAHNKIYVVYDKSGVVAGYCNSRTTLKGGPRVPGFKCVLASAVASSEVEDAMRRTEFHHEPKT